MIASRGRPRRRRLGAGVCAIVAALVTCSPALAAWSGQGAGAAGAAAATMPTGNAPSGSAVGSAVTIRWASAMFPNGTPVAGYVVHRYSASNGAGETVGAGCSGVVTTTSCTEQSVPPGSWVYTDTPVQLSWPGGQSAASAPVVVPLT